MQKMPKEDYAFFLKHHQSLPISRHLFADSSPEVTPFAETFILKAIALFVETFNSADTSKRCHLLRRNFQFNSIYPQIAQSLSEQLSQFGINSRSIRQSPSDELQNFENQILAIVQRPSAQFADFKANDLTGSARKTNCPPFFHPFGTTITHQRTTQTYLLRNRMHERQLECKRIKKADQFPVF